MDLHIIHINNVLYTHVHRCIYMIHTHNTYILRYWITMKIYVYMLHLSFFQVTNSVLFFSLTIPVSQSLASSGTAQAHCPWVNGRIAKVQASIRKDITSIFTLPHEHSQGSGAKSEGKTPVLGMTL